jgi:hypothetical protein
VTECENDRRTSIPIDGFFVEAARLNDDWRIFARAEGLFALLASDFVRNDFRAVEQGETRS